MSHNRLILVHEAGFETTCTSHAYFASSNLNRSEDADATCAPVTVPTYTLRCHFNSIGRNGIEPRIGQYILNIYCQYHH